MSVYPYAHPTGELRTVRLVKKRARPGFAHYAIQRPHGWATLCGWPVDEDTSRTVEEDVDCPTCARLAG